MVTSLHSGVITLKNDSIEYSSSNGNSCCPFLLLFRNIEYLADKNGLYMLLSNFIICAICKTILFSMLIELI